MAWTSEDAKNLREIAEKGGQNGNKKAQLLLSSSEFGLGGSDGRRMLLFQLLSSEQASRYSGHLCLMLIHRVQAKQRKLQCATIGVHQIVFRPREYLDVG